MAPIDNNRHNPHGQGEEASVVRSKDSARMRRGDRSSLCFAVVVVILARLVSVIYLLLCVCGSVDGFDGGAFFTDLSQLVSRMYVYSL